MWGCGRGAAQQKGQFFSNCSLPSNFFCIAKLTAQSLICFFLTRKVKRLVHAGYYYLLTVLGYFWHPPILSFSTLFAQFSHPQKICTSFPFSLTWKTNFYSSSRKTVAFFFHLLRTHTLFIFLGCCFDCSTPHFYPAHLPRCTFSRRLILTFRIQVSSSAWWELCCV